MSKKSAGSKQAKKKLKGTTGGENAKPVIAKIAAKTVRIGNELVLRIRATGAKKIVYELKEPTRGAVIDEISGEFRWTPRSKDIGTKKFSVRATDPAAGLYAETTFSLMVTDMALTIDPIDDQETPVGQPFSLQVHAENSGGGTLSFDLPNSPPDLSIDSSGLITGTPQAPGTFPVEVEVTNDQDESATESFDLTVTNQPPTIASIDDQSTPVGQLFSLQVNAQDPEQQTLTYQFVGSTPNLTIDSSGQISGTPQTVGTFPITVRVTDPHGAFDTESFDLMVTNAQPTIAAIDDQSTPVGELFSLQVDAQDPEQQTLAYQFVGSTPNLTIDSSGQISGTPQTVGTFPITVKVTDPHGAFATESFDLSVTE